MKGNEQETTKEATSCMTFEPHPRPDIVRRNFEGICHHYCGEKKETKNMLHFGAFNCKNEHFSVIFAAKGFRTRRLWSNFVCLKLKIGLCSSWSEKTKRVAGTMVLCSSCLLCIKDSWCHWLFLCFSDCWSCFQRSCLFVQNSLRRSLTLFLH